MKKIIFWIIAFITIIGVAGFTFYKVNYGGTDYYVQILKDGKKSNETDDSGKTFHMYEYEEKAFDDRGESKNIKFNADHNLKHNAYLKVTYNKKKGVTNWEKVEKSKIPQKALEHLK
ncbi:YxeA family protein [Weissella muntiaci]|uniref:YxeA family protein n=1 Tax=Weissella muntiaci TaxID=2508881 RepID=A0A6C2C2P6_9LACO|nr:YxeA family protein [Weissella muntiaci]TYC47763.1 YxeA family protein [Weissella muntiaci]